MCNYSKHPSCLGISVLLLSPVPLKCPCIITYQPRKQSKPLKDKKINIEEGKSDPFAAASTSLNNFLSSWKCASPSDYSRLNRCSVWTWPCAIVDYYKIKDKWRLVVLTGCSFTLSCEKSNKKKVSSQKQCASFKITFEVMRESYMASSFRKKKRFIHDPIRKILYYQQFQYCRWQAGS